VTKIISLKFVNLATPKAQAKHELSINKPAYGEQIIETKSEHRNQIIDSKTQGLFTRPISEADFTVC
jgi:hypothetical protein